jgi:hypothetical protein
VFGRWVYVVELQLIGRPTADAGTTKSPPRLGQPSPPPSPEVVRTRLGFTARSRRAGPPEHLVPRGATTNTQLALALGTTRLTHVELGDRFHDTAGDALHAFPSSRRAGKI